MASRKTTVKKRGKTTKKKKKKLVSCTMPKTGSFIMWKKGRCGINYTNPYSTYTIIKLRVPASAERVQTTKRKLRVSEAEVVDIIEIESGKKRKSCYNLLQNRSWYPRFMKYVVGKTVKPLNAFNAFDPDVCGSGIHGFMRREDAENYYYY